MPSWWGKNKWETFEQSWPEGFHDTIPRKVVILSVGRKRMKVGDAKLFDTETMYARAMTLQAGSRSLNINDIISHELAPYPASMFKSNGQMRDAKSKACLKNILRVDVSNRHAERDVEAIFLDGCAVLWVISWPMSGTVQDYLDRFRDHIQKFLKKTDVYLVFDQYKADSTKASTRHGRDQGASRMYTLRSITCLPPQKVLLNVTQNKTQLIEFICKDIMTHSHLLIFMTKNLVITGADPVPVEINPGNIIIHRQGMKTMQEEADTMIVQQVADVKPPKALVVADDTDVFVLLLHICSKEDIPASMSVLMVSPIHGRSVIDINATVSQHRDIIPNLLAAHGLTGCETVAPYFGIGKSVALNVLRSGVHSLSYIGDTNCTLSDIVSQATPYILTCYGQTKCMTMTEDRQKMWAKEVSRSVTSAPKLSSLPPTTESFAQNI